MRTLSLALVFLALIGLTTSPALAAERPILIGNVTALSGSYASIGQMEKDGLDMAVDKINREGGVLGRRIKVLHEDSQVSPSVATRKLERLILDKKVDFCMGAIASSVTLAMMEIAKKHKKIMLVPISESAKITGENKNRYTFRFCANAALTGKALAKWMVDNLGPKVYLLNVDYAWGRSTAAQYKSLVTQAGGKIIGQTFFPLGTKDFAPYFGKIRAAKPDTLFITAAGNDAISAVTQLQQYGLKKLMHICGVGSLIAVNVLKSMGTAADGIISADYYSWTIDTPANQKWVAEYDRRFKSKPSKYSNSAYETMLMLADVIKKAGSVEPEEIIPAMEKFKFTGPQGPKSMSPENHQVRLNIYMLKAKGGLREVFGTVKPGQ